MNKTHWVIQQNINENDFKELTNEIESLGMTYESFFHIPFSNEYPQLPDGNNIFVYAASYVTDQIKEDYKNFKGVFSHTTDINIHNFYKETPELMWSNPLFIGKLVDVLSLKLPEEFFIRPTIDNKMFSGYTTNFSDFKDWANKLLSQDTELNPYKEEVLIAEIDYPLEEYRLYISKGHTFASTMYRKNMETYSKEGSPEEIKSLALEFYHNNDLPSVCVIDVAVGKEKIGVIEVNSINNAGFYKANKRDWVKGISNSLEQALNNKIKI